MSKYHKRHKQQPKKKTEKARPESPVLAFAPSPLEPSRYVTLEPLAPVIVRSGRPFDGQAGVDPARFPPPSTVAGCLRTAWARAKRVPFGPNLLNHECTGPLLIKGDTLLVPKPADALYFGAEDDARCVRAEPRAFEAGTGSDLPAGLLPVQLTETERRKPGGGPTWWALDDFIEFRKGQTVIHRDLASRGWSPPPGDLRTHVAIDSTGVAADGQLFQTEGLEMGESRTTPGLRLLSRFSEPLGDGLVHLGGERRLVAMRPEDETRWPFPPPAWLDGIAAGSGLTLTLLTPGPFGAGCRPGWLDETLVGCPPGAQGVRLRLRAVALERWQPHSGWDLAREQPRATRRLVPAGAVYWFEILDSISAEQLSPLWLGSLCDGEQDRRDGFGLALPAPWSP